MNKVSRLRRSRDSWKQKARERAEQVREFRKAVARQRQKLERLEADVKTLLDFR